MKLRNKISIVLFATFMMANLSSVLAQKSVDLEYNVNEGDKYNFVTNIDMDMSFEAMGSAMTMQSVMIVEMTSVVSKVENNEINQDLFFDRIAMNQKVMGMEINYDSDDSSTYNSGMGAQIGIEMNKIIGKSVSMIIDNKGNIIDLNVSDVTSSDITNNITSGNTFAVYPEGEVKVGDSWDADIEPLEDSEMKIHVKYTLLKASRKQATIGIEGTITANVVEGQELNMDGTTSGEMIVDVKSGMLISSTIDTEMAMDIEQGELKFPAVMMSTSETHVEKVK
jgi:hypothetical protein